MTLVWKIRLTNKVLFFKQNFIAETNHMKFMLNHPHHENVYEFTAWNLIISSKEAKYENDSFCVNDFFFVVWSYVELTNLVLATNV